MKECKHCMRAVPVKGWCCDRAEINALRSVMADLRRIHNQALAEPSTLGDKASESRQWLEVAQQRLVQAVPTA